MNGAGGLTEEQRQRIEANRQKALARRAQKEQWKAPQGDPSPLTESSKPCTVVRTQQEIEANRKRALAIRSGVGKNDPVPRPPQTSTSPAAALGRTSAPFGGYSSKQQGPGSHSGLNQGLQPVPQPPQTSTSPAAALGRTSAPFGGYSTGSKQGPGSHSGLHQGSSAGPSPVSRNPEPKTFYKQSNDWSTNVYKQSNNNTRNVPASFSQNKQFGQSKTSGFREQGHGVFGSVGQTGTGKMTAEAVASAVSAIPPVPAMKKAHVKGDCRLISRERFDVDVQFHPALVEVFKMIPSKAYDATTRKWTFKLEHYYLLMDKIQQLGEVQVSPLPSTVRAAFSNQLSGKYPSKTSPEVDLSRVDESLVKYLLPFQKEGVSFGISKRGRLLLADDMGLGKTIQGICLACYYKQEWPVLVVTPSSVRFTWAQQFRRWVPDLKESDIRVAVTGNDNDTIGLIHITSYDLLAKKPEEMLAVGFRVVIMDESHLLKNPKTARCQAATPILRAANRVILLSGTPALSRPMELFPQISAVAPRIFKGFHEFGLRYCDGRKDNYGWDFKGSSNMTELQLLLEESVMIRRIKSAVLDQLPSKRREMIVLDPAAIKTGRALAAAAELMSSGKLKGAQRHECLLSYYTETAKAKIPAVRSYVMDLLDNDQKFLVFAHHGVMLDALQDALVKKDFGLIRIDGKTGSEQRKILCDKFMLTEDIKVALLSITAASTGLNLTAAAMVVFAELFWNPGILTQAEDRVHRIGQRDSVCVKYLVAKGTADDYIWPLIQNKLEVLSSAGLSKDNFTEAETTELGPKQKTILSFFEESMINECDDSVAGLFRDGLLDEDIEPESGNHEDFEFFPKKQKLCQTFLEEEEKRE